MIKQKLEVTRKHYVITYLAALFFFTFVYILKIIGSSSPLSDDEIWNLPHWLCEGDIYNTGKGGRSAGHMEVCNTYWPLLLASPNYKGLSFSYLLID